MTSSSMKPRVLLGVNIDHVATLRQARGTRYPDPVQAAILAEEAGADGITIHPREDRRHIQDRDVLLLKEILTTKMNLEMAVTDAMLAFAEQVRPECVCLVPEKREELTTEGGLDVDGQEARVAKACDRLAKVGAEVSCLSIRMWRRLMRQSVAVRRWWSYTPGNTRKRQTLRLSRRLLTPCRTQ